MKAGQPAAGWIIMEKVAAVCAIQDLPIVAPIFSEKTMLTGKTALVTGSTSGIGLGIAKALAAQGAKVVLNGFGDAAGPQAEVAAFGTEVAFHGADMSRPEAVMALVAATEAAFGGVDILVNNAGVQCVAPVEEFPPEQWERIRAIVLDASFHATRAVLP
eukprot:gene38127-61564_t